MGDSLFVPEKNVGVLYATDSNQPLGTCFAFKRPGVFLTAAHVIENGDESSLRLVTGDDDLKLARVERHPDVDVAAITLRANGNPSDFECFSLAELPIGVDLFPLGEVVASFGYTLRSEDSSVELRWMQGHIQRHIFKVGEEGTAHDYELPYPSFPGNSGSPVMLGADPRKVIAVTTHGRTFSCKVGEATTIAHWTVAAALSPIADWLNEL